MTTEKAAYRIVAMFCFTICVLLGIGSGYLLYLGRWGIALVWLAMAVVWYAGGIAWRRMGDDHFKFK